MITLLIGLTNRSYLYIKSNLSELSLLYESVSLRLQICLQTYYLVAVNYQTDG